MGYGELITLTLSCTASSPNPCTGYGASWLASLLRHGLGLGCQFQGISGQELFGRGYRGVEKNGEICENCPPHCPSEMAFCSWNNCLGSGTWTSTESNLYCLFCAKVLGNPKVTKLLLGSKKRHTSTCERELSMQPENFDFCVCFSSSPSSKGNMLFEPNHASLL